MNPDAPDSGDVALLDLAERMGLHLLDLDPCELRDRALSNMHHFIKSWRPATERTTTSWEKIMPNEPDLQWVNIGPNEAEKFLSLSPGNRRIRTGVVARYAADMTSGNWRPSNDAVCMSTSGKLLNGHHRMHAVIASGITVRMPVMRGLPEDARDTFDTGVKRGLADVFAFHGEHNTTLLAAATRWSKGLAEEQIITANSSPKFSTTELVEWLEKNPELRDSVAMAVNHVRSISAVPSAVSTAHWWIAQHDSTGRVHTYFEKLSTRADEPSGSAVLAVDTRLRELYRGRGTTVPLVVSLLVRGWNNWASGTTVSGMQITTKKFGIPTPIDGGSRRRRRG